MYMPEFLNSYITGLSTGLFLVSVLFGSFVAMPREQDPANSAVCRLSSLADSAACRLMLQQGSANSFELAACRLTSSAGPCRLSSLSTQQPGRLTSLPTHVAARFCQLFFVSNLPTQRSADSPVQQDPANSVVCRLSSLTDSAACRLIFLPTQQSSDSPGQQDPANLAVCRLSSLADSAACRLMLQQGSTNSFELAVCRLSSLPTHQFSRTLPTQQSADSAAWLTQQSADSPA
ncbi:hypothetical protein Taro_022724 [Colocasia esculenta]|uniref:Uncharacterized protein n=1 Tax=Colocasia esculenta TaxID=4460 RepID=A0A843V222_COLES|nr:hypothetical protein [Colocasia esculenta]